MVELKARIDVVVVADREGAGRLGRVGIDHRLEPPELSLLRGNFQGIPGRQERCLLTRNFPTKLRMSSNYRLQMCFTRKTDT